MRIEFKAGDSLGGGDNRASYQATLVAPLDDMWAAFSEGAQPHDILVDGQPAGCCRINEKSELRHFFLHAEFEDRAERVFAELVEGKGIVAAHPATVDPSFLSLCLGLARRTEAVALMYEHVLPPSGAALSKLFVATEDDQGRAMQFAREAIGASEAFLQPHYSERIERQELLLHCSDDGEGILAIGELRLDSHHPGHAHLGLIVGKEQRNAGLGGRLMNALVANCLDRGLKPLCSTEPNNLAARRVIERAGFRTRHRVLEVSFGTRPAGGA